MHVLITVVPSIILCITPMGSAIRVYNIYIKIDSELCLELAMVGLMIPEVRLERIVDIFSSIFANYV